MAKVDHLKVPPTAGSNDPSIHEEPRPAHHASPASGSRSSAQGSERRRGIGRILHNDRGVAFVEWQSMPVGWERPVFTIAQEPGQAEDTRSRGYNPYDSEASL